MGKKIIKKRANSGSTVEDPELEEVDDERQFEIEEDEEDNLVVFVYHYRHKFGDNFDADVEHALDYEEAGELVSIILQIMDKIKDRIIQQAQIIKVVPEVKEGNPLQGPQNLDGV